MGAFIDSHAADSQIRFYHLVEIAFASGTVRWTDADVPVVALGYRWTPYVFQYSGVTSRQGEVSGTATLAVGDADLALSTIVLAGSVAGVAVIIRRAWLTFGAENAIAADTKVHYAGVIETPKLAMSGDQRSITFELSPANDYQAITLPVLEIGLKCSARYKDGRCQATGTDTSCLKTLVACQATTKVSPPAAGGNQANFSGYHFLQLEQG